MAVMVMVMFDILIKKNGALLITRIYNQYISYLNENMEGCKTYPLRNTLVEEQVMDEKVNKPVTVETELDETLMSAAKVSEENVSEIASTTTDFTKADCLKLQSLMNEQFVCLNEQLKAQMLHINQILEQ